MKRNLSIVATAALALLSFSPANAVTLFGDVAHADALAPQASPNTVLQGAAVNQRPTLERPAIEWFILPPWMSGKWAKRGDLTVQETDYRSGETRNSDSWTDNEMEVTWGHQVDKNGNVWHANFIPSDHVGNSKDGSSLDFLTVNMKAEYSTPQEMITRTNYVVTKRVGQQIEEEFQQEALNNYTQLSPTSFQNKSSNKLFQMNGAAFKGGMLVSDFSKIGEFVPVATERGIDLRQALAAYLHMRNLDNLIPETSAPTPQ